MAILFIILFSAPSTIPGIQKVLPMISLPFNRIYCLSSILFLVASCSYSRVVPMSLGMPNSLTSRDASSSGTNTYFLSPV